MATKPYYDQKLDRTKLLALLAQLSAKKIRQVGEDVVYGVKGGGEAMVTALGAKFHVRLYRGSCPC